MTDREGRTLEQRLRAGIGGLTASERKVATALLADYPFAGLDTVAELGSRASVSVQTILRLTAKLGFAGYGEFQRALIGEIKEGYHSPIILRETLGSVPHQRPFLGDLAEASSRAVQETVAALPRTQQ